MIYLIIIGSVAWYIIGVLSFIFWWTTEYDFTISMIPLSMFAGAVGPIAFFIGWCIHGEPLSLLDKVLIRKRK